MHKPSKRAVLLAITLLVAGNVFVAGVASAEPDGSSTTPPAAASKSKHTKSASSKSHASKKAKSSKPATKKGTSSKPHAKSNAVIGSGGAIGSGSPEAAKPTPTTPAASDTAPK
jgi:cytoskeletal protein RodZ